MKTLLFSASLLSLALLSSAAVAAASPEEAGALGKTLTPIGAEKAGNADGSIPAWDGGLTKPVAGFVAGGFYPDPYASDKPLFTINATNLAQYKDKLSPGQQALLKRYPDWSMTVYPTRRSAAWPAGIYEETRQNATKVQLASGGNGFTGTTGGFPFPIPKSGVEAVWNHIAGYRGDTYAESWSQAAITTGGDYTLVNFDYEYDYVYANQQKKPEQREENLLLRFLQVVNAPPRLAGGLILVHEYTDQVAQPRKAWTYSPGQRRVRLAPNVAYDNPGTAADGLRTNDDFYMFNGATDRYDWKLVGKKELYVPYNAYKLNGNTLKFEDVLKKGHINPEHVRYELHRVWMVEAVLKPGTSHIYKRRTFYIDEDSWKILVADKYDNRDQLWRVDEQHTSTFYDVPFVQDGVEVKHDLQSGRYLAMRLRMGEKKVYDRISRTPADYTPDAVRTRGVR
ncbi:DUF1329 domain-containing protein [Solimonas sp. K1W22B-7]|uniref:DUF1329 domain-containing protein n=1 Tax=Solimonas sp. K1W22B-7 TaxID=2303331 RepID=UPI000E336E88|nr:DUF1329 domain-containing protein [Solimonas sp. K1W22B-7]AXQ31108.1 DUF1329 domain-containing protein [Solimonas sp. K1W22B-7]